MSLIFKGIIFFVFKKEKKENVLVNIMFKIRNFSNRGFIKIKYFY